MTPSAKSPPDLLLEIARCPIVEHCLANPATRHPCAEIVRSQAALGIASHHVPEPWSGHLAQAPILFLSSNPSIGEHEDYPTADWPDDHLVDYFENRFANGRKPWIKDGIYSLDRAGVHSPGGVRFWIEVRSRAAELFNCATTQVRPGKDYALSEIVHCKSRSEIGVPGAANHCADRYLSSLLALAGASTIVCLGDKAAGQFRRVNNLPSSTILGPISLHGKSRYVVFLPHPNARKKRTLANCLRPQDLHALRAVLTTASTSPATSS